LKRLISAVFHAIVLTALMNALVLLLRNLRILKRLEDEPLADSDEQPIINVLIPARNEADTLLRCLESLRLQDYAYFSVTVLDDESTDTTAEIAGKFALRDNRFKLIAGKPLPSDWAGKPWACQQLAEHAKGDVLLFVDADTWFEPDVLSRTAGIVQRERPALFSVMPHQETGSFAERLVLPGLYMLFLCGMPLWELENLDRPDVAAANGQFICIPAKVYRALGGHAAVHDLINVSIRRRGVRWVLQERIRIVQRAPCGRAWCDRRHGRDASRPMVVTPSRPSPMVGVRPFG
jgi:chlorobactene glucosyltransferase